MNGRPVGLRTAAEKSQPFRTIPEDALLDSLDALGIPSDLRQDYLSLQLTALPGWAGFIKWRGEERDYPWQQAYPAGLVKFLAIRLWYARELVQQACRDTLGIEGRYDAVLAYMRNHSEEYYLRRQRVAGRLPALYAEEVDRLAHQRGMGGVRCFSAIGRKLFPANKRPQDVAWPRDLWRWHGRLALIRRA